MNIHSPLYLFFDLDGTVLIHHHLPPENLAAMKRAQAMGHKLILNTGRSRGGYALVPEANAVPWDGMCFSASDIMYEERDISHVTVSKKDFHIWLEYCMTYRVRLAYCGRKWLENLDFTVYDAPLTEAEKDKHRAYATELDVIKRVLFALFCVCGNVRAVLIANTFGHRHQAGFLFRVDFFAFLAKIVQIKRLFG